MKKLLLSAFALSLSFLSTASLAQEGTEDFAPEKSDWQVTSKQVELDKDPLKGQNYSLIPWSSQDPEEWLDIQLWLRERKIKDEHPDWKLRLRDDRHLELVGKVLKCHGTCPRFRGTSSVNLQHLSRLLEGDEVRTEKDSVAWIWLIDGSIIRLGPEGSLSLQEINLNSSEHFVLLRLNRGHIYFHHRSLEDHALEDAPETDSLSLPLLVREANQQHFERLAFQGQNDIGRIHTYLENAAPRAQIEELNIKRKANNSYMNIPTKVMVVAPNASLISTRTNFDFVYLNGGKSYFKRRSGGDLNLALRGYVKESLQILPDSNWYEVEPTGRVVATVADIPATLQFMELLTLRMRTLELASEIWVEKFSVPMMIDLNDPKKLAVNHGYTLWGDALKSRQEFLLEFTRRIETTNLRSLENFLSKLEASGEKIERNLTGSYYEQAIKHYLIGLKTRYTDRKQQIRETNDLQYYVWILKNGRP